MEVTHKIPTAKEYIALRIRTGMGTKSPQKADVALKNSLFIVSLYEESRLIGFGRIVGDGGITFVVSDIMVDPDFQRQGLGKVIMNEVDQYFIENADDDAFITLIANKPADKLYEQFGFYYVDPAACGMRRN